MRKLGQYEGRRLAWKRWFAWRPVGLGKAGRVVWLRWVERRLVTELCFDGIGYLRSYRFEYRQPRAGVIDSP